jgi:uncharacterized protein YqjF (DUF2071 family)
MTLLTRLKGGIEAPARGAASMTARLLDLLVVTWAVPAERVRPLLPEGLTPDALPGGEDGAPVAFLQTLCAYCQDARWAPSPAGSGESFHQVTHRVLVRRAGGKRGAYVLRTDLSSSEVQAARRVIAREAEWARFSVYINGDPVRGDYRAYDLRAVGERGKTELKVVPAGGETPTTPRPFGRWEDMVDFLTRREEVLFAASTSKKTTVLTPTAYACPLSPAAGVVESARVTLWDELKLIPYDEQAGALVALLQPSVQQTSLPPRPIRLTGPVTAAATAAAQEAARKARAALDPSSLAALNLNDLDVEDDEVSAELGEPPAGLDESDESAG